ncbi:S-adenosyl-L-methionine-dependent methyltransferase [Mucor lusitanicus]|nr:S-adenosyl-L-methionine-dependent methyltransferase [Mucor lusitanicus]
MGQVFAKLFSIKTVQKPEPKMTDSAATDTAVTAATTVEHVSSLQTKRDFHTHETSTYWLPKDDEEQHRLTGQHFAVKELYEGNILTSVKETLDFEKGVSVLDVGCGAGSWIMDMVIDYPNCTYEGCDMVQVTNSNVTPSQFHWSYGNVIEKLDYPDNTFDFVHMRLFILALRESEWPIAIKEILRVTKPGGVIQLLEFDLKMTGGGNVAIEKALNGIHMACRARGQDPRIALQLEKLVAANENAKVIQTDYRSIDMTSNTSAAKKFLWDWREGIRSMLPVLGPKIGLETQDVQEEFLKELCEGLVTSEAYTYMNAIAAQKI